MSRWTDGYVVVYLTGEQLSVYAHQKVTTLAISSNRLFSTASAHHESLSISPLTLVSATACLLQDLNRASIPPQYSNPSLLYISV